MEAAFAGTSSVPPDDGTTCYDPHRVQFYRTADDARGAESVMSDLSSLLTYTVLQQGTGAYSNAVASCLSQDFLGTVEAMFTDVDNDRQRILEIN